MSVQVSIRFRPVMPVDGPLPAGADPRQLAENRWRTALSKVTGLESFEFRRPKAHAPAEDPGVLEYAGVVAPVDVTMVWDSIDSANVIFANKDLFIQLCGAVAARPAVLNVDL
jgi:hypothetical protein